MKLLITAGATREAIDPVRYLSNGSTGKTGAALAAALGERGHEVMLLHGAGAALPAGQIVTDQFLSAEDLRAKLRQHLAGGSYGAVIMAAAVADYRPESFAPDKIGSESETLTLNLVRNAKILPQLRGFSPRPLRVIGFKLTVGADARTRDKAVADQFTAGGVDAVVHNDLVEIQANREHPFRWFTSADSPRELSGVAALVEVIDGFMRKDAP